MIPLYHHRTEVSLKHHHKILLSVHFFSVVFTKGQISAFTYHKTCVHRSIKRLPQLTIVVVISIITHWTINIFARITISSVIFWGHHLCTAFSLLLFLLLCTYFIIILLNALHWTHKQTLTCCGGHENILQGGKVQTNRTQPKCIAVVL